MARRLKQVGEDQPMRSLYLTRVAFFATFANAYWRAVVSGRSCQTWTLLLDAHTHCCVKDPCVKVRLSIRNFDHHEIEMTMWAHHLTGLDWVVCILGGVGIVYDNDNSKTYPRQFESSQHLKEKVIIICCGYIKICAMFSSVFKCSESASNLFWFLCTHTVSY